MPARIEYFVDFLKLSAIPSALIPFFSGWTLRATVDILADDFDIGLLIQSFLY
jgi:hypothetical protein